MSQEIVAGKFTARVTDYSIGETKAGLPQIIVRLAYNDADGDSHAVNWYGSLKEGTARNITLAALKLLGKKDETPIDALCDGPAGGALEADLDVAISIEMQEYNGKWTPRVNIGGTSGGGGKISRDAARAKLAEMGLSTSAAGEQQSAPKSEEVPF